MSQVPMVVTVNARIAATSAGGSPIGQPKATLRRTAGPQRWPFVPHRNHFGDMDLHRARQQQPGRTDPFPEGRSDASNGPRRQMEDRW